MKTTRQLQRFYRPIGILIGPLTFLLAGCAEAPPSPSDSGELVAEAEQAVTTCIAIQRGVSGNVEDSHLAPNNGNWPPGDYPWLVTGGGNAAKALIKFDLSAIPANSTVTSANVTIYIDWANSTNTMRAHQVLDPWSEATASYANFNGAQHYSPAAEATFLAGSLVTKTFDLTNLTNAWITGASANNGILLEEDGVGAPGRHQIYGSEGSNIGRHPRLDLCYEVNVDECAPSPCQNGGLCTDGDNSYTCTCPAGWTGTNCEVDIDECASGDPCNLGTLLLDAFPMGVACTNTPGSYTCECDTFVAGPACDVACPCFEDAAYAEDPNTFYPWFYFGLGLAAAETCITSPSGTTITAPGYSLVLGTTSCSAVYLGYPSASYPVAGDEIAACQHVIDTATTFSGITCAPDYCAPNPCPAGNLCVNGETGYTCECPAGFTGTNCEINIDDCAGSPCQNGGTCIDGVASYTCQCIDFYTGTNCEILPCVVPDFSGDYLGHEATLTQNGLDVSGTWNYNGGAPYSGTISETTCKVIMTFGGTFYEGTLVAGGCAIQWSYPDQLGTTDPNDIWTKDDCTGPDDCVPGACQNGGTCIDGLDSYTCQCAAGFIGTNCELNDPCVTAPCQNGGTCALDGSAYTCTCPEGWTGTNCEVDVDECATGTPCFDATCVNTAGSYTCDCTVDGVACGATQTCMGLVCGPASVSIRQHGSESEILETIQAGSCVNFTAATINAGPSFATLNGAGSVTIYEGLNCTGGSLQSSADVAFWETVYNNGNSLNDNAQSLSFP